MLAGFSVAENRRSHHLAPSIGIDQRYRDFSPVTVSTALVLPSGNYPCISIVTTIEQSPLVVRYFEEIGIWHLGSDLSWGDRHHPSPLIASD